jgi:hypothetical protein
MKRKMRKFAGGGFSAAQEEWLGGADRTDPYILARMRSAVPDEPTKSPVGDDSPAGKSGYGEENELPQTETVTKTTISKTPARTVAKPKGETQEEYKARMEGLVKKQALEKVHPEDLPISPIGLAKNLFKRGLRTISADTAKQLGAPAVRQLENKATKQIPLDRSMYKSPVEKAREARANTRMSNMKQENYDAGAAGRARASGAMVDDLTPGSTDLLSRELRPDFKRGGKVKPKAKTTYKSGGSVSSASRRADGCAVRGKTRA